MKHAPRLFRSACLACGAAWATQGAARAQDLDPADTSGWFIRANAVARFNVKASISSIPPAKGTGLYDDGYVLPDNGGSLNGQTWNWGYNRASQIEGSTLVLNRFNDVPTFGQQNVSVNNPLLGGELAGGFYLTQFEMGNKIARVGFELGLGYSEFSESTSFSAGGTASHTTDRYNLGGIVPPLAPYFGTAQGPGPLIGLNPASGTLVQDFPGGTTSAFRGTLDASFYTFRFGPTLEVDLSKRLELSAGFGYASVYADARLKYAESVRFSNPALPLLAPTSAEASRGTWRTGIYTELRLNYRVTRRVDIFAGGDFQYNSAFTFGDSSHQVKIDLGSTYSLKAGASFQF